MERAAFLIEATNQRIGCMLNPNSLIMRRTAGVKRRGAASGLLTGVGLNHDPLLFTGGGLTELELDLIFDVWLAGSSVTSDDVRDLTGPLWRLSENSSTATVADSYRQPPTIRFIWGKAFNILGVITAIAERLEQFTPDGAPQRSWVKLRFVQIDEPPAVTPPNPADVTGVTLDALEEPVGEALGLDISAEANAISHVVLGAGDPEFEGEFSTERIDQLAAEYFGDSALWRWVAALNDIDDPLHLLAGMVLRILPATRITGSASGSTTSTESSSEEAL
ncbi:MAG: hypothetical protein U0670_18055 [Anaerolineae bacterium]